MLDFKEEKQEEDGPLGRIMTEERMREQVANSLEIQILHRLQTMTSDAKEVPRASTSLEYTALSRIESRLALKHLSFNDFQQVDKVADVLNDEGIRNETADTGINATVFAGPAETYDASDTELSISTCVPIAAPNFFKQRLHQQVSQKETVEFSVSYSIPSVNGFEELKKVGAFAGELEEPHGMFASSVVKKRRKKMNKHKYKKRRKRDRGYSV